MKILVDTSVWSLALRRDNPQTIAVVQEFKQLIHNHQAQIIGPIRQEILSGIRNEAQFRKLQKYLASFPDLPIVTEDYITAAEYFNKCRSKGLQGSNTDFLICAVSNRYAFPIFTTDRDFELFSKQIPIVLHKKNALSM